MPARAWYCPYPSAVAAPHQHQGLARIQVGIGNCGQPWPSLQYAPILPCASSPVHAAQPCGCSGSCQPDHGHSGPRHRPGSARGVAVSEGSILRAFLIPTESRSQQRSLAVFVAHEHVAHHVCPGAGLLRQCMAHTLRVQDVIHQINGSVKGRQATHLNCPRKNGFPWNMEGSL